MDKKKRNIIIAIGVAIIIVTIIILVSTLTRKVYTITFNSNGGTEINAVKVKKDGLLEKPEDPIKDGYVFDGWFYNDELFDFTTKIEKDITLEARYSVVSEFNLNTNSLSLTVGDSATLEANEKDGLTWQSSIEEIVKVENGKVTALKEGNATITVTNKDGKRANCEVTVREKTKDEVVVTKVTITGKKEMEIGNTLKLTAKITPSDATNKNITWTSSNDTIAKVDKNGKVTALKEGIVTITVTTINGKTATIKITISAKKETKPADGSNSGTGTTPSSSGNGSTSENPSTGGNSGSAGGNNTGSGSTGGSGNTQPSNPDKDTTVSVTGIEVNKKEISLYVGDNETVTATVKPDNATNKSVKWSIKSGSDYVSVNNGKITGKAAGNAVVQVCSENGNKCAEIKVTVKEKIQEKVEVKGVSLSGATSVNVGSTITLTVNFNPSNATNKKYTCTGDNDSVATVSSDCKVKGVDDGDVTITVTTEDGHYTATHKVTVKSIYLVQFKPDYIKGSSEIAGYNVTVYKNKVEWNDYASLTINGKNKTAKYLLKTEVPENLSTIKLNFKNGISVDVPVTYN